MSLAKKCNRSGKYYDHYPTASKKQYNAIQRHQRTVNGSCHCTQEPLDLCSECMDEFDKFMTIKSKSGGVSLIDGHID